MSSIFTRLGAMFSHVVTPKAAREENESPAYTVVLNDGEFEVRDYPAMLVAEVTCEGERGSAETDGFKKLFAFIEGKQREGGEISMTTPVFHLPHYASITEPALDRRGRTTVRFMMPSHFTRNTLPKPESDDIRIVEIAPARMASHQFTGVADDETVAKKTAALHAWLKGQGLTDAGQVQFAIYDPPFTPPPARRNEILVPLVA
ncbi:heme-binding protein [Parvularcula sp. LCG005]|uniref:SOUL family heme-binding protein n=1 Tax=Parvularcula sp. LCG005 TaxID=3078805 RepID=UPI00294219B8|nr:heme-binding protein [Parvularcula sp. LCG005]WOI53728.1 heme-binding protein [Parvularcula sp. LCG005]